MARIAGVNVPDHKHVVVALTAIYGIGRNRALDICEATKVNPASKVKDLQDADLEKIRNEVAKYKIEGDLRREVAINIKRLVDLNCYRGIRHKKGLPVRGQNTRRNARTRKGKKKSVGK